MEFNINTLQPLFKLRIGEIGESNAFLIALRLGVSRRVIKRAHEITYNEKKGYFFEKQVETEVLINDEILRSHEAAVEEIQKNNNKKYTKPETSRVRRFNKCDCVYISTMYRTGIVYEPENSRGGSSGTGHAEEIQDKT